MSGPYGLEVRCFDCGGPTRLVQSRATLDGSEAVAVVACESCVQGKNDRARCPVEYVVSMQMRRLPKPPPISRHDSYHPANNDRQLVAGFGHGGR